MRLQRLERIVAASRAHAGPLAIDLALRLTLLDLLLRPVGNWVLRPVFLAIAAIALIRPAWLRHPLPWFALAAMAGARVLLDWPLADNHAYLLGYWCLAAALALSTGIPDRVLAVNGRLLIGLVFLLPFLYFYFTRKIKPGLTPKLIIMFILDGVWRFQWPPTTAARFRR